MNISTLEIALLLVFMLVVVYLIGYHKGWLDGNKWTKGLYRRDKEN
jgi:hypothetical protein